MPDVRRHHMKTRVIVIAAFAFLACERRSPNPIQDSATSAVRNQNYELQTRYVRSQLGPAIHFTFKWLAPEAIDLYPHELPWGSSAAVELWARDQSAQELQGFVFLSAPGGQAPIPLSRGSVLGGALVLPDHFPSLPTVLRKSPVVVMWLYPRRSASNRPPGFLTGRVNIPRDPQ
jgi:hypothetical protein